MLPKADRKKKVVVVGGGPAGMKAAITAAERGHDVSLYEGETALGGQLICADYDSTKQDLKRLKDYLSNRLYKSGAKVHLNTRMDPQKIRELNADSIILALGAYPVTFQISGMEKNQIMTAIDAYKNLEKTGKNVVIIGGGSIGCELGVDLAKMGRKVTILELGPVLNRTLNDIMKVALKTEMDKCKNLTAITETSCKEIREHSVITEMEDGSQKEILADTVIFAAGMRARLDEANEYFGIVQDTNIIGDANRVGTVWSALEDGYYISAHL